MPSVLDVEMGQWPKALMWNQAPSKLHPLNTQLGKDTDNVIFNNMRNAYLYGLFSDEGHRVAETVGYLREDLIAYC